MFLCWHTATPLGRTNVAKSKEATLPVQLKLYRCNWSKHHITAILDLGTSGSSGAFPRLVIQPENYNIISRSFSLQMNRWATFYRMYRHVSHCPVRDRDDFIWYISLGEYNYPYKHDVKLGCSIGTMNSALQTLTALKLELNGHPHHTSPWLFAWLSLNKTGRMRPV